MQHVAVGQTVPIAWKHEAPHLADHFVPRERLRHKIEEAIGKRRATGDVLLISAPPGFGKTALLADWAQHTDVPVMWYHLDAYDDDPAAFLYGMVRALRTKLPRGQWNVKALLASIHGDALTPAEVRLAADTLADDIRQHVSRPMTLILTGITELSEHGGARIVLDRLLTRVPDHLRLVLERREIAPSLLVSPLLVQHRLANIDLTDLQLTTEELGELLARLDVEADAEYLADLQELCCGWVTGVLLATGALWPGRLGMHVDEELNREAVFAYLANEVIDRLPSALREFAMRAAIFDQMKPHLCEQLLHVEHARERLGAIGQRTGFVTHVGRRPKGLVYRFQPLFRQALLDRLRRTIDDGDQLRALHIRAGQLLEQQGDYEEAVQQYAAAEEFAALVELIEAQRGKLQRAGCGETLARWIHMLPNAVRERRPQLQALLAELHRLWGSTAEALALVQQACESLLPPTKAMRAPAARALTTRADALFTLGSYEEARADCEQALRLAPDDADELHIQAHFTLAACLNNLAGPEAARESLGDLEQRCKHLGDFWALARLFYMRSNLALAQGAWVQAERDAERGLRYAEEADDKLRKLMCRLNLGGVRQYLGRLPAARADLESALALGESIGHTQGQAYALLNLADLEVTRGDYAAALEQYEQAADLERRVDDQQLRVLIAAGGSYALTLLGQPAQAVQRLDAISWQSQGTPEGVDWDLAQTAYGFAAYHLGNLAQARETLEWVCEHTLLHARRAEHARAQVILAAVLCAEQRTAEAEAVLRDALDASAALDGGPTLLYDARLVPALWPVLEAMDHSVAHALLAQIASGTTSAKTDGEPALAHAGIAPGAIEAWAMGDAHVHMSGHRVTFWPRAQTSELFFFLLDQRQPVSREVILASVWEDTDPKVADADFRRARSELKKALSQPWLEHKDGRWWVTLTYWLDVHEFERLADEGERLAKEGHIGAAAAAIRQALELRTGQFLDDSYTNWAVSRREALEVRRLDLLERLAELDIMLQQYDEAADCCHKLLDAEPYRESGHRGLMLCYAERGEPSRAMAQYRRCVETLRTELGVTPDTRTTELGRKIRAALRADAVVSTPLRA